MRVFDIAIPDVRLASALQDKINNKTKPHGALGRLERLALQIGLVQHTLSPELRCPAMLVFAGDHGIVESGVSPYPQAVTAQMVLNFIAGGAGINVFAKLAGMKMRVIDAGVNHIFEPHAELIDAKIGMGTRNFLTERAMTRAQCEQAFARGAEIAAAEIAAAANVLGFGEMGIGNTSSAAALMSVLCQLNPAHCVGRGTGLDDTGVQRKQALIEQALQLHKLNSKDPLAAVEAVGGFEIAMMAGAMLGAAEKKAVLIIDGFIASAALLVASKIAPAILHYCVFAHCSDEAGHRLLLEHMQAEPLLNLELRLGEGTGAALAYPLLQAAVGFLNDMASFDAAGVSRKTA